MPTAGHGLTRWAIRTRRVFCSYLAKGSMGAPRGEGVAENAAAAHRKIVIYTAHPSPPLERSADCTPSKHMHDGLHGVVIPFNPVQSNAGISKINACEYYYWKYVIVLKRPIRFKYIINIYNIIKDFRETRPVSAKPQCERMSVITA